MNRDLMYLLAVERHQELCRRAERYRESRRPRRNLVVLRLLSRLSLRPRTLPVAGPAVIARSTSFTRQYARVDDLLPTTGPPTRRPVLQHSHDRGRVGA
jgi:hypothetical protein